MLRNDCKRDMETMNMNYQASYQTSSGMNQNPCPMPACPPSCSCSCPPITECPQNQVCHRVINYEVPHLMPMNTTVVNHHVYNHTYTPVYSYNEVDEVENVYNRCCK